MCGDARAGSPCRSGTVCRAGRARRASRAGRDETNPIPKPIEANAKSRWLVKNAEMGGFEDAFLERLIYQRNRNWIAPLESMLEQDEEALVIVGAAHLIGDGSVLDLLEEAGYRIERIQ